MRLSFAPFPNAIPMTYFCPPMVFALNCARSNQPAPINLPDDKIAMRVWVEIPVERGFSNPRKIGGLESPPSNNREAWVIEAAAWIVAHCDEVDGEIRRALITPVFLN